jgi:thiamine transporter
LISIRQHAEIGVSIALAIVLGTLTRFIQMPFGGSINLSLLPIVVLALRRGPWIGGIAGGLFGVVDFVLNPFFYHPLQVVLDYPLAFACMGGFSGLGVGKTRWIMASFIAGAGCMRLLLHWLSGILFFASYAPVGTSVWWYALTYNSAYVVPETVLCIVLSQLGMRMVRGGNE